MTLARSPKYWGRAARDMPRPGRLERARRPANLVDRISLEVLGTLRARIARLRGTHPAVRGVLSRIAGGEEVCEAQLEQEATALSPQLRRHGFTRELSTSGLVLAARAVRLHFGFWPRREQLAGAAYLLEGRLVEMATGEGKTVTALLAAAVAGLAGRQVHVVTVNSYLAQRDHAQGAAVLATLGLDSAAVHEGQNPGDRAAAMRAVVVYADNKELTFEYLRALLAQARMGDTGAGLPHLDFAIVDEADSILIDEAATPLIIAEPQDTEGAWRAPALTVAGTLREGIEWRRRAGGQSAILTPAGRDAVDRAVSAAALEGLWRVPAARREWIEQALVAVHIYRRDIDYLIDDGKVVIIDAFTGRRMPDRAWQAGLHQLVEAREGLEVTSPRVSRGQITFRDLFGRYRRLSGMTGTGREVAGEFLASFGMGFVRLQTHRPVRRQVMGLRMCRDRADKSRQVAVAARELSAAGRAVLVGTRSLEAYEIMAAALAEIGSPAVLLTARDPAAEARIIAGAGARGCITVATNMAGRGADIPVPEDVQAQGGLHVLLTEFQDSRRVDRQLIGRSARNGQPGSWSAIVALDDDLFARNVPGLGRVFERASLYRDPTGLLVRGLILWAQFVAQWRSRGDRAALEKAARSRLERLAFAGHDVGTARTLR